MNSINMNIQIPLNINTPSTSNEERSSLEEKSRSPASPSESNSLSPSFQGELQTLRNESNSPAVEQTKEPNPKWIDLAKICTKKNLKTLLNKMITHYQKNPKEKKHLKNHAFKIFESIESPPEINNFKKAFNSLKVTQKIFFTLAIAPHLPYHLKNLLEYIQSETESTQKVKENKRKGQNSPNQNKRQRIETEELGSEGSSNENTQTSPKEKANEVFNMALTSFVYPNSHPFSISPSSPLINSARSTPLTQQPISAPISSSFPIALEPPLPSVAPKDYFNVSLLSGSPAVNLLNNLSTEEKHMLLKVSTYFIGYIGEAFFPNTLERPCFEYLLEKSKGQPIFNLSYFSSMINLVNANPVKIILNPFYQFLLKIDAEKTERTEEIFKVIWCNAFYTAGIICTKSKSVPFETLFPGKCKNGTPFAFYFEEAIAKSTQWHKKNHRFSKQSQLKLNFSQVAPQVKSHVYMNFFVSIMNNIFDQYSNMEKLLLPYNYVQSHAIDLTDSELMPPPAPRFTSHQRSEQGVGEGEPRSPTIANLNKTLILNRLPETANKTNSIPQFQFSNPQYEQQISSPSLNTSLADAYSYSNQNQTMLNYPSMPYTYSYYAPTTPIYNQYQTNIPYYLAHSYSSEYSYTAPFSNQNYSTFQPNTNVGPGER